MQSSQLSVDMLKGALGKSGRARGGRNHRGNTHLSAAAVGQSLYGIALGNLFDRRRLFQCKTSRLLGRLQTYSSRFGGRLNGARCAEPYLRSGHDRYTLHRGSKEFKQSPEISSGGLHVRIDQRVRTAQSVC